MSNKKSKKENKKNKRHGKNELIKSNKEKEDAVHSQDFEKAATLRDKEKQEKEKYLSHFMDNGKFNSFHKLGINNTFLIIPNINYNEINNKGVDKIE